MGAKAITLPENIISEQKRRNPIQQTKRILEKSFRILVGVVVLS
jgi:hypothetical protein